MKDLHRSVCPLLGVALFLGHAALVSSVHANVTGAIYTSDSTCSGVNVNVDYPSKDTVFLDGGPKSNNGQGLPPGDYYVQITTPDGIVLGTSVGTTSPTPVHVGEDGKISSCYKLWDILVTPTGEQGYDDTTNQGGEYKVWISKNSQFVNSESKTDNFKVKEGDAPPPSGILEVRKFYDASANGLYDEGEIFLELWKINITDGIVSNDRFTTLVETFTPGTYGISEYFPVESGWHATTPTFVEITLSPGDEKSVLFGNLCLGQGGGHTKGFWGNKNGEHQIGDGGSGASELALLKELNLRTAKGAHFDPATYAALNTWLKEATAVNMAYMLSAQYAAMALNVEAEFSTKQSMIYAPGTESANALGYASLGDVMTEANTILGSTGAILAGNPLRARAEAVKNALDYANNNLNFVQATPCPYSFE